jgi:hypothetical protein
MTALHQHTKIAVALGYSYEDMRIGEEEKDIIVTIRVWKTPEGDGMGKKWPPNYPHDLNAMHEAEKTLKPKQALDYWNRLNKLQGNSPTNSLCLVFGDAVFANAEQRAEAFLRTLNLWED